MSEVIGVTVTESESTQSWQRFFHDLIQRELAGVELVISDLTSASKQRSKAASWVPRGNTAAFTS